MAKLSAMMERLALNATRDISHRIMRDMTRKPSTYSKKNRKQKIALAVKLRLQRMVDVMVSA